MAREIILKSSPSLASGEETEETMDTPRCPIVIIVTKGEKPIHMVVTLARCYVEGTSLKGTRSYTRKLKSSNIFVTRVFCTRLGPRTQSQTYISS